MSTEPIPTAAPTAPTPASTVPSPCVSLCKMDQDRLYCLGCMRTIAEIVAWSKADDDYKRAVLAEIALREQAIDFD